MVESYWMDEIRSYDAQWYTGPDDEHSRWKWREFLKLGRIMLAETKCKRRMNDGGQI